MQDYNNPRSSKIRKFIKINFLSEALKKTKSSKEKVLDLGCGWGFYFAINPLACGVDADKNCIKYLQNLGYNVIKSDISKILPVKNKYFEWVICHDVLEHFTLEDTKKIMDNAFLALKNGGRLLIISPNKKGYDAGLKGNVGHKHFITLKEIIEITKGKFSLRTRYFSPFPEKIGKIFTHNKEIIILEKISG